MAIELSEEEKDAIDESGILDPGKDRALGLFLATGISMFDACHVLHRVWEDEGVSVAQDDAALGRLVRKYRISEGLDGEGQGYRRRRLQISRRAIEKEGIFYPSDAFPAASVSAQGQLLQGDTETILGYVPEEYETILSMSRLPELSFLIPDPRVERMMGRDTRIEDLMDAEKVCIDFSHYHGLWQLEAATAALTAGCRAPSARTRLVKQAMLAASDYLPEPKDPYEQSLVFTLLSYYDGLIASYASAMGL